MPAELSGYASAAACSLGNAAFNFALSVALAFLAFGLWLRLGRIERTRLRSWIFVPISLVVFFTHTYGWGLLGLMCFSADAVRLHDRGDRHEREGVGGSVAYLAIVMCAAGRLGQGHRGDQFAGLQHRLDLGRVGAGN